MNRRVLVTGATGFVGSGLVPALVAAGYDLCTSGRSGVLPGWVESAAYHRIDHVDAQTGWMAALEKVDTVVHLAARVHVMRESVADPLTEFRRTNSEGALNLARQAVQAGVRRFVFLSSIKVNGEHTAPGHPFTADATPAPVDPYGVSKLEAEMMLMDLASDTGLELVIIRPVLVYGPGVKANFLSMMQWLYRGIPLPLGAIHNLRSLVALDNLVSLIETCIRHPDASGQVFLVSDGEDLSTTELLHRTADAMGRRALLIPLPQTLVQMAGVLTGKRAVIRRICGSLQVDISKNRERLGWTPSVSTNLALRDTAMHFLASRGAT